MFLHRYPYAIGYLKLWVYRLFMGKKLHLSGKPRLSSKASLRYRKNAKITLKNKAYLSEGTLVRVTENAAFTLGENSGFNSYCVVTCREKITIGDNVMFGPFCTIHDHDHIFRDTDMMKTSGYVSSPVVIEDNVWIGGNVTILKGVRIGSGSVIAAGTVVTKDVAPNTVLYEKKDYITQVIKASPALGEYNE